MSSNWKLWFLVGAVVAGGVALAADDPQPVASNATPDSAVARGQYLITLAGCNDCHTPLKMGPNGPEPDMSRMFSGHPEGTELPAPPQLAPDAHWNWSGSGTLTAFSGPWGVSYARNLTPDPETGLGKWTEEQFVRALRTGRHQGIPDGRMILPPMPWQWIGQASDDDLHAIWSYLRSIPPIRNDAPQSVPAPTPPPAATPAGKR